jgi:hypothetical protein
MRQIAGLSRRSPASHRTKESFFSRIFIFYKNQIDDNDYSRWLISQESSVALPTASGTSATDGPTANARCGAHSTQWVKPKPSPTHQNDRNRSMKLTSLAPLGQVPGVRYFSLQKGNAAADGTTPPTGMELVDWTEEMTDFADTAALMASLDLVIAVDTSVVHLAGAMGKPVWTLLPFVPDWRWLQEREDSPRVSIDALIPPALLGRLGQRHHTRGRRTIPLDQESRVTFQSHAFKSRLLFSSSAHKHSRRRDQQH